MTQLAGSDGRASRASGAPRRLPFIGRESELASVLEALQAARDGRGSLVLISGEPGIGKTRLAEEAEAVATCDGFVFVRGKCHEYEGALPYRPWVELIRGFGIAFAGGSATPSAAAAAAGITRLAPEFQLDPASAELHAPADRLRLFDNVSELLLSLTLDRPVLVVIEDLHWADPSSLFLLQYLARRLDRARLCILATFRDTDIAADDPLRGVLAELRERRLALRLHLGGFDEGETRAFLAAAASEPLERISLRYARAIWAQTDGNPYFVEELLRYLIEVGTLRRTDGRWRSQSEDVERLAIPLGVREVLGRRIGRLSPLARDILSYAAILGREFDLELLRATARADEPTVTAAIEQSAAAYLVGEGQHPRTYRFIHALVRGTLVESLTGSERAKAHLRAAQAIEEVHHDRLEGLVGELAAHYRATGDRAYVDKIASFGRAAMEAASRSYAWEEARHQFEETLAALERLGAPPLEMAKTINAHFTSVDGDFTGIQRVRDLAARAVAIYAAEGDEPAAARAMVRQAETFQSFKRLDLVDYDHAFRLLQEAMAVAQRHSDEVLANNARGVLANVLFQRGNCAAALRIAREMLATDGRPAFVAWAHMYIAICSCHLGAIDDGRRAFREAWQIAWPPHGVMLIDVMISWHQRTLRLRMRAPAAALEYFGQRLVGGGLDTVSEANHTIAAASASRDGGELVPASETLWNEDVAEREMNDETRQALMLLRFREGEWEEALAFFRPHLEATRRCGATQLVGMLGAVVADIARTAGCFEEAEELLQPAVRLDTALDRVSGWAGLGLVYAETGRDDKLAECVDRCDELLNGDDWLGLGARVELVRALARLAAGEERAAEQHFESAVAEMRRVEAPWDEAEAHYLFARALARRGAVEESERHTSAGVDILRRIGAPRRWIERMSPGQAVAEPSEDDRRAAEEEPLLHASTDGSRKPVVAVPQLTRREWEVLRLIARGQTNGQIAAALFISEPTVATHVRHILQKTGTGNRTEAASHAVRLELA